MKVMKIMRKSVNKQNATDFKITLQLFYFYINFTGSMFGLSQSALDILIIKFTMLKNKRKFYITVQLNYKHVVNDQAYIREIVRMI